MSYVAFDPRLGRKVAAIDPNNVSMQWGYDRWGREAQEKHPDGSNVTTTYTQVADPSHGLVVQKEVRQAGGQDVTTQFDERGRPTVRLSGTLTPCVAPCAIQPLTKMFIEYDPVHLLVSKTSIPVDASVLESSVPLWATRSYDAAGRLSVETPLWGSASVNTQYAYSGAVATITEPDSDGTPVTKKVTIDGAGRPTQITELAGVTSYTYGPFGQLINVSAQGTVTSRKGDPVGNATQVVAPDSGTTTWTYDGFGHLTSQTTPAGTTQYTFDVPGRPLTRTDSDGIAKWTWDGTAYGVGKLASVTTQATATGPWTSREDYTYTPAEQLASQTLTLNNESFQTSYIYDGNGNVFHITYPPSSDALNLAPFVIENAYDTYGDLVQVTEMSTKTIVWKLNGGDYEGHDTSETLGNLVSTTRTYLSDKNEVQNITSKKVSNDAVLLQNLTYTWDDRRRLTERQDALQPTNHNEFFHYDTSDRLTCAGFTSSGCDLSVAYYDNGNIKSKTGAVLGGVGTYKYDLPEQPHAVTKAGSGSYTYDNVGNQITRPDANQIKYTAVNLLRSVDSTVPHVGTVSYAYDGLEQRIQKTVSGTGVTTVYSGGLYERALNPDGSKDHSYFVNARGRNVAIFKRHVTGGVGTETVSYVLADHLGSPSVLFDSSLTITEQRSYDAFGQARNINWSLTTAPTIPHAPISYTGQEDEITPLIDYKGRTYDSHLGRFLQADPIVGHPETLQGWNRYSYVRNNPLTLVDPSGLFDSGGGGTSSGNDSEDDDPYASDQGLQTLEMLQLLLPPDTTNNEDPPTAPAVDTSPTGPPPTSPPDDGPEDNKVVLAADHEGGSDAESAPYYFWNVGTSALLNPAGPIYDSILIQLGAKKVDFHNFSLSDEEGVHIGVDIALNAIPFAGEELGSIVKSLEGLTKYCFPAGTPVLMCSGEEHPIESLQEGDEVASFNADTGQLECRPVLQTFERTAKDVLTLHWLSGDLKALDDLHATSGHRFWVLGKGWTHARDLVLGDRVPRANGQLAMFAGAEVESAAQEVFNIEVAVDHDYWVGSTELLAHNAWCGAFADAGALAKHLLENTAEAPSNVARMFQGAKLVSALNVPPQMKIEALQLFMNEFGFATSFKQGIVEGALDYTMYSQDSRYAFKFVKESGEVLYGKFNFDTLSYEFGPIL